MSEQQRMMITGASGFTGIHACENFLKQGFQIIAVTSRNQFPYEYEGMTQVPCNLTRKNEVFQLIQSTQPHYLLHLAGQNHVPTSWNDPMTTFEVNCLSTIYIIEAIRRYAPLCKIVVVGSLLQFDQNQPSTLQHPYSFSKTMQAIAALSWQSLFGMNIMIAKPSNLIGPGNSNGVCSIIAQRIAEMERKGSDPVLELNNLYAARDFLDVRDAVKAYARLFESGTAGEQYHVCSGNTYYIKKIAEIFHSIAKVDFRMKGMNDNPEPLTDVKPTLLSNLGWTPQIPLKQSLTEVLEYKRRITGSS